MVASWFVCRIKNCYPFYFVALLLIIGVVCSFCINGPSDVVRLIIAQFLINLGVGIITLLVPMLLFSAIGSAQTFVILFSLCLLFKFIIAGYLSIFIYSIPYIGIIVITLAVIALLLLLPLKKNFSILHRPKGSHQPSDLSAQNPLSSHYWPFSFHFILFIGSSEFTGKCNLWRLRPDS